MKCPLCKGYGKIKDTPPPSIGQRVAAVRNAKQWSKVEMASKLQKSVRMVTAYENGEVGKMHQDTYRRFRRIERSILKTT